MSKIVSKILFVEFQGVMSFKFPIFSGKFQDQNTFLWLRVKSLSFLSIFWVKSDFSNFQYCQNFKTWIFKGRKRKYWWKSCWKGRTLFFLQKFGNFNFLNLVRGSEIMKVWILRLSQKFYLLNFRGVMSLKFPIFSGKFQDLILFYDLE